MEWDPVLIPRRVGKQGTGRNSAHPGAEDRIGGEGGEEGEVGFAFLGINLQMPLPRVPLPVQRL